MRFFRRHKILTTIFSLILVLVVSFVGVVNYYLSKINFIRDGDPNATVPVYSTDKDGYIVDKNGNRIDKDGNIVDKNGKPIKGGKNDPDDSEINSIGKLSKKEQRELDKANDSIRRNLDDTKKWYSDQVFNVMLFGYDYGSPSYPYGRSDSMIVVSINKALKKVKLISLSRTAYSAIPGYENTRMSHAHGYGGAPLAIKTIELNYKFRIDHFIGCSFDSFKKIIDAFGGVDISLSSAEANALNQNFHCFPRAGAYHLNGEQALNYARLRKIDNDRTRTGRQRTVLMALKERAKSLSLTDLNNLLNTVLPLVSTDFSKTDIVYQMANAMSYLNWDFEQHLIPAEPYNLVLRGQFEVIIMDWEYEVGYLHDVMYEGVIPQYEEK